jgi:hypothetical protein
MGAIDLKSNIVKVELFTTIARTTTATIQGSEISDFRGQCFVVDLGAWTADGLSVTFQESDDNSAWTDIAAADLEGDQDLAVVTGTASTIRYTGYKGLKKYIGAKITDGASGNAVVGVTLIKGYPKDMPQNS